MFAAAAASYEKLSELIELIDSDLERKSQTFGTELRISQQWMVGEEVMRLNQMRQISVDESWIAHKLIVTDQDFIFRQNSASHAEIYMAGKSEVKEIRRFLKDKTYMTCPFGTNGSGAGSLPEHYRFKLNI